MRRKNLLGVLFLSACLAGGSIVPVSADSMRVVTLGADLTQEQKDTMLRYFNVNPDEVQIMYITNQDEIEHLSDYVPLSQIGTRTVSCAYVRPTESGGIKVRTANLNWVTGNMIASSLSTSGVKNCEVIAACPFEVSGTGALTGIQMAYETATGTQLDSAKKEVATKEIVVTGNLADNVGIKEATTIINESKKEVIQNNIQNNTDINNVVNNVVQENNVNVDSEQLDEIVSLLEEIAQQGYDYDDVKETLERVEDNVMGDEDLQETGEPAGEDGEMQQTDEPAEPEVPEEEDEESIMDDVNTEELGDDVKQSSTEDPTLEEETQLVTDTPAGETQESSDGLENTDGWEVFGDEGETTQPEGSGDEWEVIEETPAEEVTETPAEEVTETPAEEITETPAEEVTETPAEEVTEVPAEGEGQDGWEVFDENGETQGMVAPEGAEGQPADGSQEGAGEAVQNDLTVLTEDQQTKYTRTERFCAGEYEGDAAALQEATEDPTAAATVVLDAETGKQLSQKVKDMYYSVLRDGAAAYVPDGTEVYMNTELNMVSRELKKLFGIDGEMPEDGTDILANVSQEDRQVLYDDTLGFFEDIYGEGVSEIGSADGPTDVYVEDAAAAGESLGAATADGMSEELSGGEF